MIYNNITNYKNRKIFRTVVNIILIAFTFTTCSCYSSQPVVVKPDTVLYQTDLEIVKVILKDGLVINLKDRNAKFDKSKNCSKNKVWRYSW